MEGRRRDANDPRLSETGSSPELKYSGGLLPSCSPLIEFLLVRLMMFCVEGATSSCAHRASVNREPLEACHSLLRRAFTQSYLGI